MKRIDLIYNPYSCSTKLLVNGTVYAEESRLHTVITGRPMEEWLDYRTVSYRRWRGLLPELIEEMNDDELEIAFTGLREDYLLIVEALKGQRDAVSEAGYANDGWKLNMNEKSGFEPENVRSVLLNVSKELFPAPNQMLMLELNALNGRLNEEQVSVEQLRELIQAYVRVFDACAEQCPEKQRASWENASRQVKGFLR